MCLFSSNEKSGGEPFGAGAAAQNVLKDAISFSLSAPTWLMCGFYSHSQQVADPSLDLTPTSQVEEKECRGLCVHPVSAPTSLICSALQQHFQERGPANPKDISCFFFPQRSRCSVRHMGDGLWFPFQSSSQKKPRRGSAMAAETTSRSPRFPPLQDLEIEGGCGGSGLSGESTEIICESHQV